MSESFADRLSMFTPDGSKLDRDSLLFAAGRASACPNRRWLVLCGTLAACQLLTLGLLWPRPQVVTATAPSAEGPPSVVEQPPSAPAVKGETLAELRERALASEVPFQPPPAVDDLVPSGPPLRAFGAPPSALVQ